MAGIIGSAEAAKQLQDAELQLHKLNRTFESYFNGFERVAPIRDFEAMKRVFRKLTGQGYATAAMRFKAQNLIARWQMLRGRWERDLARMEMGSLKPGVGAAPGRSLEPKRPPPGARKPRSDS